MTPTIPPYDPYIPPSPKSSPDTTTLVGSKEPAPEPSLYTIHKFQIGGDAIDYYTKSGEKDKIFVPEAMLERLTLLSPKSAAAVMDKLA